MQRAGNEHAARAEVREPGQVVGVAQAAAGVGRFLVPELARRLGRPMVDFGQLVEGPPAAIEGAARSAPAAAVALLAAGSG